jgi:hypothetical protein
MSQGTSAVNAGGRMTVAGSIAVHFVRSNRCSGRVPNLVLASQRRLSVGAVVSASGLSMYCRNLGSLVRRQESRPRFGQFSTSDECLEYDGIFDAATVLTDYKQNRDCLVASEQWKWKRQQIIVSIISRCCRAEKSFILRCRSIPQTCHPSASYIASSTSEKLYQRLIREAEGE